MTTTRSRPPAGLPAVAAPVRREARPAPGRPSAPLVAQLLAARMGLPQTRSLRRASPADAAGTYRRAVELHPLAAPRRRRTV